VFNYFSSLFLLASSDSCVLFLKNYDYFPFFNADNNLPKHTQCTSFWNKI